MLVNVDFGNVARKVKDIATKLGLIDDYVVERGTSGIWTWRKWSSGVVEAEATHSRNYGTGQAFSGAMRYASTTVALPKISGVTWTRGYGCLEWGSIGTALAAFENGAITLYVVRLNGTTVGLMKTALFLKGTWK